MQLTKLATFTIKCHQNELILFVVGEECYEKFVTSLSWGKSCSGLNNEQDKAKKNSNLMKWNTSHGSIGMTSLGCLPCKMYLIYAMFTLGLVGNHVVKGKDNEQIKMTKGTKLS